MKIRGFLICSIRQFGEALEESSRAICCVIPIKRRLLAASFQRAEIYRVESALFAPFTSGQDGHLKAVMTEVGSPSEAWKP